MIRVLLYFILLGLLAYGGMWVVENPGHVSLTWLGYNVDAPAALLLAAVAFAAIVIWGILRFILAFPSIVRLSARHRRREKGYAALSRGLIAVHSGDGRAADRAASQASRHLKDDPLALMLRAQSAHLNGDAMGARAAYEELSQRHDTRLLGLRGLHAEATARGDDEAAYHFATIAHRSAALPWSAQAVLGHRASTGEWEAALATLEASLSARLIDKEIGERHRAVLETAIALDKEAMLPDAALALARSALKRAPDLAPALALATRLYSRRGDIRKAAKLVEKGWPRCQHPEVARAYLDVRPGDSTTDRLGRAKTLMGIASFDPVGRITVVRAAMACKDFKTARAAIAPLIAEGQRPTVRMCLLMAEMEEAEYGDIGQWREWLARASRAPFDPAWVADGIVYDHWEPTSPTTGRLDAFRWQVPAERQGPAMEAIPAPPPPVAASVLSTTANSSLSSPALFHREAVDPAPVLTGPPESEPSAELPVVDSAPELAGSAATSQGEASSEASSMSHSPAEVR